MNKVDFKAEKYLHLLEKTCTNKTGIWKNKSAAYIYREKFLKNNPYGTLKGTEPYKCIFCGNWHLGHP